jgi:hypothetical protein
MKTTINIFLIFLVHLFFMQQLCAQDFKADYKKVQGNYLKLQNFYCEVKVNIYEKASSPQPQETMSSTIKKQGLNYLYVTGKTTLLMNSTCMLRIDGQEKSIVYTVKEKKKEEENINQALAGIADTILKRNDSAVFGGVANGKKKYTVYTATSPIVRTELYIDQQTGLLAKMIYYYKIDKYTGSEKIIIEYENINLSPEFSDADFSEKKYVVYSGKVLKPVTAFANYKTTVIDPKDFK